MSNTPQTPFQVGDKVVKTGGSYTATGTIIAIGTTSKQQVRLLFEFDLFPGMLHVFAPENLQPFRDFLA